MKKLFVLIALTLVFQVSAKQDPGVYTGPHTNAPTQAIPQQSQYDQKLKEQASLYELENKKMLLVGAGVGVVFGAIIGFMIAFVIYDRKRQKKDNAQSGSFKPAVG